MSLASHWCADNPLNLCTDSITCALGCLFSYVSGETDQTGELTEKEIIRQERNSGVVGGRVREIQVSVFFFFRMKAALAPGCLLLFHILMSNSTNADAKLLKKEGTQGAKRERPS